MPTYEYTARDRAGQVLRGQLQAESDSGAAAKLREMGLWVTTLRATGAGATRRDRVGEATPSRALAPVYTGVSAKDKSIFYRQLHAMVNAGMPLYQALTTLTEQEPNRRLRAATTDIARQVLSGGSLSEAMARHDHLFSRLELRMIQAGELGGLLDSILERLADYMEREHALRQMVKQKTLYPKLLLLAFIFIPAVPTLVLKGPQAYTREVVGGWLPLFLMVGVVVVVFRYLLQLAAFRNFYDQLKLGLPVTGPLVRKMTIARFARSLAALYGAGVGPATALVASGEACGNAALENAAQRLGPAVERGSSLSQAILVTRFFPPMFTGMVSTGEQTGNLDQMLDKAAEFYENEATHATTQLVVILGVLLLLTMAVIIAMKVIGFWGAFYGGLGAAGE